MAENGVPVNLANAVVGGLLLARQQAEPGALEGGDVTANFQGGTRVQFLIMTSKVQRRTEQDFSGHVDTLPVEELARQIALMLLDGMNP